MPYQNDLIPDYYEVEPPAKRGVNCSQIIAAIGLVLAILVFLFGDNIIERFIERRVFSTESSSPTLILATSQPIAQSEREVIDSENNGESTIQIPGKVWQISFDEAHQYQTSLLSTEQRAEFIIEATLKFEDSQDEFHGVAFHLTEDGQFYSFRITPQGQYAIDIWGVDDEETFSRLLGPLFSESIQTGSGQKNKIGVKANGSVFEFYINDVFITSVTDSIIPAGAFGLISCTCDGSESANVSFYDVLISSVP